MQTKFVALATANITEKILVNDSVVSMTIDPVFKMDTKPGNEVSITGSIDFAQTVPTEIELCSIIQDCMRKHVPYSRVRKVEIRTPCKPHVAA